MLVRKHVKPNKWISFSKGVHFWKILSEQKSTHSLMLSLQGESPYLTLHQNNRQGLGGFVVPDLRDSVVNHKTHSIPSTL